jgi:hypothetical protein
MFAIYAKLANWGEKQKNINTRIRSSKSRIPAKEKPLFIAEIS